MTVIVLEKAPNRLRGILSTYLLEVRAGVFVGKLNAKMRQTLWERVMYFELNIGSALMLYPEQSEQGFGCEWLGQNNRTPVKEDDLWLVSRSEKTVY